MKRLALLLLFVAAPAFAAPPTFDPPAEMAPVNDYVVFAPNADCVNVKYIGLDKVENFPLELIGGNKTAFFLPTRGLAKAQYRFVGVASSATGEQVRKDFVVVVGGGTTPPTNPPTNPPVDPPPSGSLYFAVVRPNGPANPLFTKVMGDPAWGELIAKGHVVKDFTEDEVRSAGYNLPAGTMLPCVLTLRLSADKKTSTLARGPVLLPDTSDKIRALAEVK